jgi:hypothetical protein
LQPILNIPRQMIREGRGHDAYTMLETLYHAARERTTAVIDDQPIDLSTITSPDDHKSVCTLIWAALLADGTRALAQAGRWKEAASHAASHRGTGRRLLDGRQAAILALAQEDQVDKAAVMVEQSTIAEPWEHAVQSLLRVLCLHAAGTSASHEIAAMLADALALAQEQDRSTAVMRTRVGIIALDLTGTTDDPQARLLRAALIATAATDAYAARDILAHNQMRQSVTTGQRRALCALVRASGLGAGSMPERLHGHLMTAARCAVATLTRELEHRDDQFNRPDGQCDPLRDRPGTSAPSWSPRPECRSFAPCLRVRWAKRSMPWPLLADGITNEDLTGCRETRNGWRGDPAVEAAP